MGETIHGLNPVREALSGGRRKPLELFLLQDGQNARLRELARLANENGVPLRWRGREDLERLAGHGHHQGAVLRIEDFAYVELERLLEDWRGSGAQGFLLALDGVTDPHNFGALLRSAEACGCQAVIVTRDNSCPVTAVVERASAGALEHIALCRVTNLARALEELKRAGFWVYGLAGEGQPLYRADLSGHLVLVAGSEGKGLRANVRRHCDGLLALPMAGRVASLNVSVATAVALYEAVRQRGVSS